MGSKKTNAQNIVQKKTADLIPYEFNNKVHNDKQVDMICNSIAEFGFQNPILVDEKNIVIAGHGRLEAAKKLKMENVPCIIVTGLSNAQIKKLRILDNRIGDFAEYDKQNLFLELEAIADPAMHDLFVDFDLGNMSDKNQEIDPNTLLDDKKTCTCPKCGFEFDPKQNKDAV